ncbi:MAG TPA: transcription elongation factor GreA [Candidatus Dormibacteraeota bacterium]|jgi:transcription elongation factor GreA|nr:transcription elongation factor GreA [Candidatus Dormibacteraeota bacterium]
MAQRNEVPITAEGLAGVKRELEQLVKVQRPEIVARIKAARELGDLSENFEYHAARNQQSFLETRVLELEGIVRNHVLVENHASSGIVEVLSTVTFAEEDQPEETYRIVPPAEADPGHGRLSFESALGHALLGHKVGDEIEVEAPGGSSYTVRLTHVE